MAKYEIYGVMEAWRSWERDSLVFFPNLLIVLVLVTKESSVLKTCFGLVRLNLGQMFYSGLHRDMHTYRSLVREGDYIDGMKCEFV